ncbi:ABC transporter permease [Streptacidiphilus carbonis]|uniref:ABC transporter permease n=1 Tax=Streptacidiphilus carbonis TaxID=105422 RepID=UPI0005A8D09D|nr:ABC transporter permease [Streptacidiphilus carbonis]
MTTESTSAAAPGYNAASTLPLRVEAVRQIRRRRTAVTFALMAALPVIVWAAMAIGGVNSNSTNTPDLIDVGTSSGINFAFAVVFLASGFLLSVPVALFFGDTIASEANWSSLRYLLVAPVSRARLLYSKFAVALGLSVVAMLLLPATALAIGMAAYGQGDLHLPSAGSLPLGTSVSRFALIAGYMLVCQLSVATFALWLSTVTDAPLGAVGGAVGLVIVSSILDNISALGSLRTFLPTHGMYAWAGILQPNPEWTGMIEGVSLSLSLAAIFTALALRHFRNQDIVS